MNKHLVYPQQVLYPGVSEFLDKVSFDAFSNLRVSNAYGLLESKFITGLLPTVWQSVTDTSGVVTYLSNESAVKLELGTGATDYCYRQTFKYFPYVAGNSQRIRMTGNFLGKEANRVKRMGYFDDLNGVFFELASDDLYAVVRSRVTGTTVDKRIKRTAFNVDKLDGTGPSGIVMDYTKSQIFQISFQWLGVGSVSFGFSYLGKIWLCHVENHANFIDSTYMSTANLPVRYEIRNTALATGTASMKQICCSVASEGGYNIPSLDFSAGNQATGKAITNLDKTPVMAIRLKNSFNSKANRRVAYLKIATGFVLSGNALFEVAFLSGVTSTTATWSDVEDDSAMEVSTDISAVTAAHTHTIEGRYLAAGVGGTGGGVSQAFETLDHNLTLAQNYDSTQSQMFVVYFTSLSGNITAYANLQWAESE